MKSNLVFHVFTFVTLCRIIKSINKKRVKTETIEKVLPEIWVNLFVAIKLKNNFDPAWSNIQLCNKEATGKTGWYC